MWAAHQAQVALVRVCVQCSLVGQDECPAHGSASVCRHADGEAPLACGCVFAGWRVKPLYP